MPIVVTGAAGFIGSRLALALANSCPEAALLLVDHPQTAAKTANMKELARFPFMDHNQFLQAFEADPGFYPLVFHMGACSSTVETDWTYLLENNLRYSQRLWQGAALCGGRLIYASSAATYGDGSHGFDDEADIGRLVPLNLYGKSKQEFDVWIQTQLASGKRGPRQCVGLKFFNVWGPGETHKGRMASMAFHAFHQIKASGSVKLFASHRPDYADGGQLRDFIYVGDVVQTMLKLAAWEQVSGLFNLGTGTAISFNTYISAVFVALGLAPRLEYVPMPQDLEGKYQYFTEATMQKLTRTGAWTGATALQECMDVYVGYLSEEGKKQRERE